MENKYKAKPQNGNHQKTRGEKRKQTANVFAVQFLWLFVSNGNCNLKLCHTLTPNVVSAVFVFV